MRLQVDGVLDDRRGAAGTPRVLSVLLAVALHAGLVGLFMLVPRLGATEREPIEYVPVTLVPPPRLGVEEAPAPRQEALEPEPEEPVAEEMEPEPEPETESEAPILAEETETEEEPEEEPEPTSAVDREPEPSPQEETVVESREETTRERTGPPGSPEGSPTSELEHTASVATFDNPDFTYGYYVDRMLALIRAHWVRPPMGSGVEVMVHFRIGGDGEISDIDIRRSSGYSSFDLAALRAVRSASPLPPLPRGYDQDSLGVNLIFR